MDIKIVIAVNKKDFWFCRICVASIRYYYPEIGIWIIKDLLNGSFSTSELETRFNVAVLDLGIKNYGWAAAKMHVILSKRFEGERILLLDSDIVFIGRFLENLLATGIENNIIVDAHYTNDPSTDWFKRTYYDINFIKSFQPDFIFPGYVFNTGQMIVSPGVLKQSEIIEFFDLDRYPYWKNIEKLPTVDQSLLNFILPYKEQKEEISIAKAHFMLWSESEEVKFIPIDSIKNGKEWPYVIHWAGALRTPNLKKMTRPDILEFFESFYYRGIRYRSILRKARYTAFKIYLFKNRLINKVKNSK